MEHIIFTLVVLFSDTDTTTTTQVRDIPTLKACEAAGKKLEDSAKKDALATIYFTCVEQLATAPADK